MSSINTFTIIQSLNQLSAELNQFRNITRLFNIYAEKNEKEYLKLDNELEQHWSSLIECIPGILGPKDFPLLDKKITLVQWLTDLVCIFKGSLFGHPLHDFALTSELDTIEIWQTSRPHYPEEMYNGPPCLGDFYWGEIYSLLNSWQETTKFSLEAIDWIADLEHVSVVMRWGGMFHSIEPVNIKEVENVFWRVSFQSGQSISLFVASTVLLLNTQLLLLWGGNKLTLAKVDQDRLTLTLKVLRADTSNPPPVSSISEKTINQILNYIITEMVNGYVEISKHLEYALQTEIKRLESYFLKRDLEEGWFNDLQDVLKNLTSIREGYNLSFD